MSPSAHHLACDEPFSTSPLSAYGYDSYHIHKPAWQVISAFKLISLTNVKQ
jgi:hypothetical protein